MKTQILFASGNKGKLGQFQFVADALNFDVEIISVYSIYPNLKRYSEEFDTPDEIAKNGAKEIYKQIKQPIFTEDSVTRIPYLYKKGITDKNPSNEYLVTRGLKGILEDMKAADDRSAIGISCLAYYDGKKLMFWKNVVQGRISKKISFKKGTPRWVGPTFDEFGGGYNPIFLLKSRRYKDTLADLSAMQGLVHSYRDINFIQALRHLENSREI